MRAEIPAPQPFRKSGVQNTFKQKLAVSYPTHLVSTGQSSIRPRYGPGFRRSSLKIQRLVAHLEVGLPPLENLSEATGPYGRSLLSSSLGPDTLQHWLSHEGHLILRENHSCTKSLIPWKSPDLYQLGVELGSASRRKVVVTDASKTG